MFFVVPRSPHAAPGQTLCTLLFRCSSRLNTHKCHDRLAPHPQAPLDLDTDGTETLLTTGQTHELWWDADSAVLNSRARHTIKVPGSLLDQLAPSAPGDTERASGDNESGGGGGDGSATAGERSLNGLLDCMFGREDVALSLFWSAGGAGARQGGNDGEANGAGSGKQGRSPLGRVVLRRADLLPLVRRTSARVVLRLPIEPAGAEGRGREGVLPAPEVLPLSISYRREPSAVARRKSRCRRGGHGELGRAPLDGGAADQGSGESDQTLGALSEAGSAEGQARRNASRTSTVNPGADKEKVGSGGPSGEGQDPESGGGLSSSPGGVGTLGGSGVEFRANSGGSPISWERDSNARVHRSSGTGLLLPARTKLCVRVDSVIVTGDVDAGGKAADSEEALVWVSFDFPGSDAGGQAEREKGGVFLWMPADEQARHREEVHWSPAVVASRDDGRDRVAPLEWSIEVRASRYVQRSVCVPNYSRRAICRVGGVA